MKDVYFVDESHLKLLPEAIWTKTKQDFFDEVPFKGTIGAVYYIVQDVMNIEIESSLIKGNFSYEDPTRPKRDPKVYKTLITNMF